MDLFSNYPITAALAAIIIAQVIKIPIHFIATKEFAPGLAFSTGGMPSSHSAAVTALSTAIGYVEGFGSTLFAVAAVFSTITMYDASGVRRHAGKHATILNQLVKDFQLLVEGAKNWENKGAYEKREDLKELLGHKPIEVFFGAITGIVVGIIFYHFY
ncbi:divergent PAP2 family protein [Ornithinibacillus californiensis]|uniref:divergent PAP2 family protein n=1 Tax=Ornithinibacillus californiensis TaxID=161536 RepID=UPI00064DFAA7|nr:divergent PAP2 family protein [Ornithinibacillus californiensis]